MPKGSTLIGFADDILLVVTSDIKEGRKSYDQGPHLFTTLNNWMRGRQLEIAAKKTEAVLLTRRRKISPINFVMQGISIPLSAAVKFSMCGWRPK